MSRWTKGLNPEQIEAVAHTEGPLLILAGAGSGKTTVLVHRSGRLIDDKTVPPERLLVLTFTNKAARELKSRVADKIGEASQGLWAGTFHSFGLFILRRFHKDAGLPNRFGILDPSDAGVVLKELLKDFNNGKSDYDTSTLGFRLSQWRESGQTAAVSEDPYDEAIEWLLPRYLRRLQTLGMVDFDTLILKPVEMMRSNRTLKEKIQSLFDFVMIDEFQDTNQAQMALIKNLTDSHRNISVVGDDDQAIYGWRGACVKNILQFPKFYSGCKVIKLERNYRSTPVILEMANAVIVKNKERHDKSLRPHASASRGDLPELFVFESESDETEGVAAEIARQCRDGMAHDEIAVLYRSNSQGAQLEAELRKSQIPYRITGGTAFFDRKEVRDVLAFLRCGLHANELALRRVFATPPRGIGDKTVELVGAFAQGQRIPFVEASRNWKPAGVDAKIGRVIDELFVKIDGVVGGILGAGPASQGLLWFLESIGYRQYVNRTSSNPVSATKRWRLIEIFGEVMDRYLSQGKTKENLALFMDAMELRDVSDEDKNEKRSVQLLTLHACKGLEFPLVFLMGVEEDLLPHKTLGSDLAEERRLFYVGVTRAKKHLILTRAKQRMRHGKMVSVVPSRFLLDIPKGLLSVHEGGRKLKEADRKAMIAQLYKKIAEVSSGGPESM